MTEPVRDAGDERVLYDDQHTLLRVTRPTRLLGAALGGVHVLDGGPLIASGIINQRLIIDSGGTCYATGYIRAVPKVAAGGLLDIAGHLNPVRWPAAHLEGTVLIAVRARYGNNIVNPGGVLAPYGPTVVEPISDATPRFRITRSGPEPTFEGPVEPSLQPFSETSGLRRTFRLRHRRRHLRAAHRRAA